MTQRWISASRSLTQGKTHKSGTGWSCRDLFCHNSTIFIWIFTLIALIRLSFQDQHCKKVFPPYKFLLFLLLCHIEQLSLFTTEVKHILNKIKIDNLSLAGDRRWLLGKLAEELNGQTSVACYNFFSTPKSKHWVIIRILQNLHVEKVIKPLDSGVLDQRCV